MTSRLSLLSAWIIPAALAGAILVASCRTGGELQPIVIDLSKKTPTPTPAGTTAPPTAAPPTAAPAASATPAPTSTPTAVPSVAAAPAAAATAPSPAPPSTARPAERALSPEEVVRQHLDAWNRRDLEALLRGFAPDAQLFEGLEGTRERGLGRIRSSYARRFAASAGRRLSVARRIVEGSYVVENEVSSGAPDERTHSAIVIYRVEQGKITAVWFLE